MAKTSLRGTVERCVPRHDDGFLIKLLGDRSGAYRSPVEIPEGVRVIVRDGQAVRA